MKVPGGEALTKSFGAAVDKVVERRYEPARAEVARLRQRRPSASDGELADAIIRRYRAELGALGAASGGVAAAPGIGTGLSFAATLTESGWVVSRLAQMILEIGIAYGHDAQSIEERRAWVLVVLGAAAGAFEGIGDVAGLVGRRGGAKAVKAIPMSQIVRINQALGGRIFVKLGERQGVIRLGTLIPFGLGAVIGMGGNVLFVNGVGARAEHFFDQGPPSPGGPRASSAPPSPDDPSPAVIDVEVVEPPGDD